MDKAKQQSVGIEIQALIPAHFKPELKAYGIALDLKPLLDLRIQFFDTIAENSIAKSVLKQSVIELQRLKKLLQENIIPRRKVIEASGLRETNKARLNAHQSKLVSIKTKAIQQWGEVLSSWCFADDQKTLNRLFEPGQNVILVSLNPHSKIKPIPSKITISTDSRERRVEANLISRATQSFSQSESFYYLTHYPSLLTGMKVIAWLPQSKQALSGVTVEESAVIWHLGKPYVYVLSKDNFFSRRPLINPIKTESSWFVQQKLVPGELIVTKGAQMLLSEEYKGQIPEEDQEDDQD
ncbi:MAG: hypothetical protein V3U75_10625 [Methylococcaceae bacterium]